jgi:hypothetical protein
VKLVCKIKYAVSYPDKIGIAALHTAEMVGELRRYAAVDLPPQPAAPERKNRKIKVRTAKVRTAKVRTVKVRTAKVRTAKVRIVKVRTAKVRLFSLLAFKPQPVIFKYLFKIHRLPPSLSIFQLLWPIPRPSFRTRLFQD